VSDSHTQAPQEWASGTEMTFEDLPALVAELPFPAEFALLESPAEIRPVAVRELDMQSVATDAGLTEVRLFGDEGEIRWRQPEADAEPYPVRIVAADPVERDGWDTIPLEDGSDRVLGLWKGAPMEGDDSDREMNLPTDWDYPGVPGGRRAGLRVRTYADARISRFVRFEPMSDD
jgi:hypothetical protein